MVTVPPDSEGDLGRQLLAVTSPNSESDSTAALIELKNAIRLMENSSLNEPQKQLIVRSLFSGPELADPSITYFRVLRNSSAIARILLLWADVFVTTEPLTYNIILAVHAALI